MSVEVSKKEDVEETLISFLNKGEYARIDDDPRARRCLIRLLIDVRLPSSTVDDFQQAILDRCASLLSLLSGADPVISDLFILSPISL